MASDNHDRCGMSSVLEYLYLSASTLGGLAAARATRLTGTDGISSDLKSVPQNTEAHRQSRVIDNLLRNQSAD